MSYYGIVRKNLLDSVPKAIMHFLVNSVRANIQEELVIELYREEEFSDMLREADDVRRRRRHCSAAAIAIAIAAATIAAAAAAAVAATVAVAQRWR